MFILTLVATIIHMNYGFEFPEALGRGVVSAFIVAALAAVGWLVIWGVVATIKWMSE